MSHRPHHSSFVTGLLAACAFAAAACTDDETAPTAPELGRRATAPAPSPLATVNAFGPTVTLWPFTGDDFGQSPKDPVNLIFAGQADARALRAAFLMLDGDRTAAGLPPVPPFNCTWSDNPNGDVQTAYAEPGGWLGSAIQLACGGYDIRFHVRLFETGGPVLGGAHFEVLIPGTATHEVLSWERAEQLVMVDLLRSGLLDAQAPLMPSGAIHPSPWRDIRPEVYNGLPVALHAYLGGPLGNVTAPVPTFTDGAATIFNLARTADGQPGVFRNDFTITFGQLVPKPFCASGPYDYLYVAGPVNLREQVVLTPSGNLMAQFHAIGHLDLTPVDPSTAPPTSVGEPYRALVEEHHRAMLTDRQNGAFSFQLQIEIPPTGPFRGRLVMHLDVGPHGATSHSLDITCTP